MISLDLDTIKYKRDEAPKQKIKNNNQESMQRQSKETRISIRKITEILIYPKDSVFKINDSQKQEGLKKKKASEE
jgi:hypothetical protein